MREASGTDRFRKKKSYHVRRTRHLIVARHRYIPIESTKPSSTVRGLSDLFIEIVLSRVARAGVSLTDKFPGSIAAREIVSKMV